MIHWLLVHWHALAAVSVVLLAIAALQIFLPGVWPRVLAIVTTSARWIASSKEGRIAALAVATALTFHVYGNFRYRAGRDSVLAEQKAAADRAQAHAAAQALTRNTASSDATAAARQSAADRSVDQNTRAARVEGIAHESRPPVPVVCPAPDPRLVRESQDATARIHAAEDRLRGSGRAAGAKPR